MAETPDHTKALRPTEEVAYLDLDRPQRLGFLPTKAFWRRGDVWRAAYPLTLCFAVLWFTVVDLFLSGVWVRALLCCGGVELFRGLLERHIRKCLRRRHQPARPST